MIRVENLTKTFKYYTSPADRLKEIVSGKSRHRVHAALRGVSFMLEPGRTLGVIGQNGSGKSTLLKILAGVLLPDSGSMHIHGRVTGLLELGTGFNPEFSGIENIRLNGALLGMSRPEIQDRMDAIAAFSELGSFIHEPIKTYSSGMVMRLAFSIAIHADPDVFLVDEALAVGDAYFQQKCMRRIRDFRRAGGSILFVSHDMNAVKTLCDEVLLLDDGRVVEKGHPEQAVNTYNFMMARKGAGEEVRWCEAEGSSHAYGNLKARVVAVNLKDGSGREAEVLSSGKPCSVKVILEAREALENVTVGILFRDRFGQDIFGTNTFHLKRPVKLTAGERILVRFEFKEFNIGPGKYTLTVAVHSDDVHVHNCYHWMDNAKAFEVIAGDGFPFIGLVRLPTSVKVERLD
ncbi:MAG: ABC transporter ATP-binding protein [Thermodesulfobacteriota bacterium]|nr:ABC transporter ATP-binding protein [Thermodesulfobacteriota bacterium]